MKRFLIMFTLLLPGVATAGNYDVTVTREDSNVYRIMGKDAYVHTRYCYEYVYSEDSVLRMSGTSGTIIFLDEKTQCDVEAVYTASNVSSGKYDVNVSQEDDNLYEVSGTDLFIKTDACLNLAMGEDALLQVTAGGSGTLYFLESNEHCDVESVLSKARL